MYSPAIKPELVVKMWRIKQTTGVSITQQANTAIKIYLEELEQTKGCKQRKEVTDGPASDGKA